jgi:nucleotide-binding universal stress UspA family protein
MPPSNSILLAAERGDAVHQSLSRALMLARYLDARLDILLCNLDRPFAGAPAAAAGPNDPAAEARAYLASLLNSVNAPDVEITADAAFEATLHEHVARKARLENSLFVVKGLGGTRAARDDYLNRQLIESCPVPLLLNRGRAWHPRPRFAALIDLRHGRATAVAAAIVTLGQACGADLDLLCLPGAAAAPAGFGVAPERLHMLGDDAAEALPQFVAARGYDLIALTVSERGLAERLLEPAAHDLLFVKPAGRAVDPAAPDREGGQSPPAPMGSSSSAANRRSISASAASQSSTSCPGANPRLSARK